MSQFLSSVANAFSNIRKHDRFPAAWAIGLAGLMWTQTAHALSATGGDITTNYTYGSTYYRVHVFTNIGTTNLTVNTGGDVEVLVVAGGGGGGNGLAGGGGAGGLVYSSTVAVVSGSNYVVTVGKGGAGGAKSVNKGGVTGSNSVFGSLIAYGGGGGSGWNTIAPSNGGSGGGGMDIAANSGGAASPGGQGNAGGDGHTVPSNGNRGGGGGGGAGSVGSNGVSVAGGDGGIGLEYPQVANVAGSPPGWFAGGGGGGTYQGGTAGNGGKGGGGSAGAGGGNNPGYQGTNNTGGGGGSGAYQSAYGGGGTGGCGIVIVMYPYYLNNVTATNVTDTTADLVANLTATGAAVTTVWMFWDTTDHTTNKTWTHSSNFIATGLGFITNSISGLTPNETNYFTYYSSNTEREVWAQPSLSFKTWGTPAVDNDGGATNVGYTIATLRGTLLNGNAAFSEIRWGTDQFNLANTSAPVWVAEEAFSVAATGLVHNTLYYYQCYVSNIYGNALASLTNFITTHYLGNYYVATNGPVGGDGSSWAMALTNIQSAINSASNGDTICVKTGVYNRTSQVVVSNKTLSIIGGYTGTTPEPGSMVSNPAATVVDAQGNSRVMYITIASNVVLSNLTFSGGNVSPGLGLNIKNSSVRAVDCAIQDNTITSAGVLGGGLYANGGTSVFERCSFLRNAIIQNDWQRNYGGAVYHNAGDLELRSCVLAGSQVNEGGNTDLGYGGALYAGSAGRLRLYNCLIRDNFVGLVQSTYSEAITCAGAGTVSIENCTVAGNFPRGINRRAGTVNITNSIVWNNGDDDLVGSINLSYSSVGDTNTGAGVQHSDPQFVQGYYLADGSPCTNAGSDSAANVGLTGLYAQTNTTDAGQVDLGYHHAAALSVTNIYVAPGGDDTSGTGAAGAPYRSVTKALAMAPAHARINIAAGSYTTNCETFPLVLETDGVQLLGTNAESTLIDAKGANQRVMDVSGVSRWSVLSNLTFRGGYAKIGLDGGAGLKLLGTGVRLYDCSIRTNVVKTGSVGSPWTSYGGGVFLKNASPWFERCEFIDNIGEASILGVGVCQHDGSSTFSACRFVGNKLGQGSAIGIGGIVNNPGGYGQMRLVNCLIVSNSASAGEAGGIHADHDTLVSLNNCTLADNSSMGLYGIAGSSVSVTNSILWNNGIDATGTVTLTYCDIGVPGANVTTNNCISADPLFVSSGDYRLQTAFPRWSVVSNDWVHEAQTSPCIDAGTNQEWMTSATDQDGLPRLSKATNEIPRVDLGAYEAKPNSTPAGSIFTFF